MREEEMNGVFAKVGGSLGGARVIGGIALGGPTVSKRIMLVVHKR